MPCSWVPVVGNAYVTRVNRLTLYVKPLTKIIDFVQKQAYYGSMRKKPIIYKEEALALYPTVTALGEALDITSQAISQWPNGQPIPDNHARTLYYELKPQAFGVTVKVRRKRRRVKRGG